MPNDQGSGGTSDQFLGGKLVIKQPRDGYRAGSDPVFLAASVPARAGQSILDVGAGVGTAGLCLAVRVAGITLTGLEIQPALAALACANAEANGLADRYEMAVGALGGRVAQLRGRMFDHVVTNPPWYEPGAVCAPVDAGKAVGHVEGELDLAQWLRLAGKHVKPKGGLWVVHRADRLGDILAGLRGLPFGATRVFPLWPKAGKPAHRVLVSARKDSRTPPTILPGLLVHDEDGAFTPQADAILRGRAALDWG